MNRVASMDAVLRLREGNDRFVQRLDAESAVDIQYGREDLITDQRPFAVVLGCSDSRVPVEIVFDQGPGDLFVIRVAGNIATPPLIGSVEFAATTFGTGLVVVLGHTHCGAVAASLQLMRGEIASPSPNIEAITDYIRPVIASLDDSEEDIASAAVRANVRQSMRKLHDESPVLRELADAGQLAIVGAEFSLETGIVEFFDNGA